MLLQIVKIAKYAGLTFAEITFAYDDKKTRKQIRLKRLARLLAI